MEPKIRPPDLFRCPFPKPRVTPQPRRQRPGQPQPLPAEGKPGPVLTRDLRNPHQHLETAVEEHRVRLHPFRLDPGRQRHLAERLARTRPQPGQRPAARAEGDAPARQSGVHLTRLDRRQAPPQVLHIHRLPADDTALQPPLRVEFPSVPVASPARHPPTVLRIQKHLHGAPLVFGHDENAAVLDVVQRDRRSPARRPVRLDHLGGHEHTRRDDLPVHPVFRKPIGLGGGQLPLERRFPGLRIPAHAEQWIRRRRTPAFGRLDPIALALERIRRQRHPAALLAREQTRERDVHARLVGRRHRVREVPAPLPRQARHQRRRSGFRPGQRLQRPGVPPRPDLDHDSGAERRKSLQRDQRVPRRGRTGRTLR